MKLALTALSVLAGIVILASQDASAQVAANEGFLLAGSGYSISANSVSDATVELVFTTSQTRGNVALELSSGLVTTDERELTLSSFSGTAFRDGQIIIFTSKASDSEGKQYNIRASGRLVAKTETDSIYSITGAITDSSQKTTRLVCTVLVSEFVTKTPQAAQTTVTVKILKGASSPSDATYQSQIGGFRFSFVSDPRLTINPGTTVVFVNEDTVSHSLKSGTGEYKANKRTYVADGKMASGEIQPGKSWSATFNEQGFFRLFDEKYQWIDVSVFVIDKSQVQSPKTQLN